MKQLKLEATQENAAVVSAFVEEQLEDCPMRDAMKLSVAVEELYVNVASYAYAPRTGPVEIRTDITEHSAEITFIDSGRPYNPLEKPDPDITLSAEDRPIGGLGIYMVKKSMDAMTYRYENGQNIVTIRKNF